MEIVSYVLEGSLAHKDSMGTGSVIVPGDVQYMSAGTGVRHSEFNASDADPLHFLQIWILPDAAGYAPRYGQRRFEDSEKRGRLRLVASPSGEEGSLAIRQDVRIYSSLLGRGEAVRLDLAQGRHAWVQVARGSVEVNGNRLSAGDGLSSSEERTLSISYPEGESELLAFDLA
jgi:redox-sensitive bicupin YhaK (pirin superfamily)